MDLLRDKAPWMVEIDDCILETLSIYGGLKLYPLHRRLVRQKRADVPIAYVLLRCKRLREYALLSQQDGVFVLTETARAYLDGELDAATLSAEGTDRHEVRRH